MGDGGGKKWRCFPSLSLLVINPALPFPDSQGSDHLMVVSHLAIDDDTDGLDKKHCTFDLLSGLQQSQVFLLSGTGLKGQSKCCVGLERTVLLSQEVSASEEERESSSRRKHWPFVTSLTTHPSQKSQYAAVLSWTDGRTDVI